MSSSEEALQTPLHQRHVALHGKMVPFAGYSMPIQYSGIVAEHKAVREAAGIFDVCHMGEIRIVGAKASTFVNLLVTNDLERIAVGQAMYTCACRESGAIVDDLIVYKQADDDILIVCNASNREKFWAHLHEQGQKFPDLSIADESEATGLIALQGPRSLDILRDLEPSFEKVLMQLRPFRFTSTTLKGCTIVLARTGYTGEDGVEIFCKTEDAGAIWDALMSAGASRGLKPAGLGARDTLRLEARLSLYGNELDEETTPLEAGLAWTVKFEKRRFLGREALLAQKEQGLAKKLVGFEVLARGSARAGYRLLNLEGLQVGKCTSGGPSPTLKRPIGLGYLPPEMTEVGTDFLIDCRGKHLAARVVKTPFYRRP